MIQESGLIIHELLCLALLYSVFCRGVHCSGEVRVDVRLVFFSLGLVACAEMVAPLAWGMVPDIFSTVLLAGMVAVQMVTAHHWACGVPDQFYKPGCAPRHRRAHDIKGECGNA